MHFSAQNSVGQLGRFRLPFGMVWQTGVIAICNRSDIESVIFLGHAKYISTWIGAIICRVRGKHHFFWTHGWRSPDKGVKRFVRRTFYRLAHSLLLYGHHAKCIAIQEGFSPSRLFVVYNSLDYPSQRSFRKSLSGRDLSQIGEKFFPNRRVPMILCCCRLTKQRCAGIEQLFEAMEILPHRVRIPILSSLGRAQWLANCRRQLEAEDCQLRLSEDATTNSPWLTLCAGKSHRSSKCNWVACHSLDVLRDARHNTRHDVRAWAGMGVHYSGRNRRFLCERKRTASRCDPSAIAEESGQ